MARNTSNNNLADSAEVSVELDVLLGHVLWSGIHRLRILTNPSEIKVNE